MRTMYEKTLQKVQELLRNNPEWEERYERYSQRLNDECFIDQIRYARDCFNVPAPFRVYMSVSMAMNKCTNTHSAFELRFHGQSVAELYVPSNQSGNDIALKVKCTPAIYTALESAQMADAAKRLENYAQSKKIFWHDTEAQDFRKIYADLEQKIVSNTAIKLTGQPEHEMESELLRNYAQKLSKDKEVSQIQPVIMNGTNACFQMPTPLGASQAKKGADYIKYSAQRGGGIDILARMGIGRGTTLAVLELKDQNNGSEPPEKAICQAIAYATFLRELLRSKSGQAWWNFFGFQGQIPQVLHLKAIVVMPNEPGTSVVFGGQELKIGDNVDSIKLGYIYRKNVKKGLEQIECID